MDDKKYTSAEEKSVMAAEPSAAVTLSDSVRQTGLLGQVMSLSRTDKEALIRYLKTDVGQEEPLRTDEFGRIVLTPQMRMAAAKADRDYEDGKCLNEDGFKQRFAKWL